MTKPTKEQLQQSLEFVMEALVAYTNSLDRVVRKPFAEAVTKNMQNIALSLQMEPPRQEEKKDDRLIDNSL